MKTGYSELNNKEAPFSPLEVPSLFKETSKRNKHSEQRMIKTDLKGRPLLK